MNIPFSTVLSFLLSAPITNFVVVGIILAVFGIKVATIYFVWTFSAAVAGGLLLGGTSLKNDIKMVIVPHSGHSPLPEYTAASKCCEVSEPVQLAASSCNLSQTVDMTTTECDSGAMASTVAESLWESHRLRLAGSMVFAKALFLRIIPYILAGAAISGITAAYVPTTIVQEYAGSGKLYAIPIAAAIGVPLYLRIEMAVPLLKVLMLKGMGLGAAMALLIGGTGASLPEMAILSAILKPRAVAVYALVVCIIATIGGFLFHFLV